MRGLYAAKAWYTRRLRVPLEWCVRRGVSPDVLSACAVLCAIAAAPAIAWGLWPLAVVLVAGRLAGANLDGAVARAGGKSRPFGAVVNELGDRLADMALAAGLVWACYVTEGASSALAWAAAVAAGLPTFVSLAGSAAGAARINGGPFGKTERCAAYVAASVCVAVAAPGGLDAVSVAICAGSVLTAAVRLRSIARSIHGMPEPNGGRP